MSDAHKRAAVAERAARAGGAVARERFRGRIDVETKADKNDLVTVADRDAQAQVVATVHREFPEDAFLCEEPEVRIAGGDDPRVVDGEEVPRTGSCWVIDPIDGTANYVRGASVWATSVAAVVDGETVGAANYLPATGDLYAAGPESATRDGTALATSDRTDPETFAVAMTGRWAWGDHGTFGDLCRAIIDRFGDLRRIGSFQASLSYVADGALEGVICPTPTNPWDTVAGVYMVRRAGGTVTDLSGDRWRPESDGLVASNGTEHEALLEATRAATD